MRRTYRVLAGLIALLVLVQAAAVTYGAFSIGKTVDQAKDHRGDTVGHASGVLDGGSGYSLHSVVGMMIIPTVALALLAVAGLLRNRTALTWAALIAADVAVQVALGQAAHSVPALGWLHGPNALILLTLAGRAARRPHPEGAQQPV